MVSDDHLPTPAAIAALAAALCDRLDCEGTPCSRTDVAEGVLYDLVDVGWHLVSEGDPERPRRAG